MDIKVGTGTYYNPYDNNVNSNKVLNEDESPIVNIIEEEYNKVQDRKKESPVISGVDEVKNKAALNMFMDERLKAENKVPYSELAEDGIINYKGIIFVCDNENQAICLGDMSNPGDVLTIPLSGGGCLMVNRNEIGSLSKAIGMFSPEDRGRIMRAIAQDNQCRRKQAEIELFDGTENGVEEAWKQAAKETGCDGFGYDKDGKLTHITQLTVARLLSGKDSSVLGNTVESALSFAQSALYRLNNPMSGETDSDDVKAAKADEKRFYEVFIEKLKALL